jgi:YVTN family beta-propeller protein
MISGPLLAISRTEANKITILKCSDPEQELATIPVASKQPFGLAFDETRQWLYAACWTSGEIAAISLDSLRAETSLRADGLPAWATRREGTGEVWISRERAGVVTILDSRKWSIAGEIATGGGPSDIAFTHNGRHAWVTNEKDRNVALCDAETRRKIRDIRIGKVPQGIAVVNDGSRLLVANFGSNSISVVDTEGLKELTQISVGRGPLDVVAVQNGGIQRAWVTCFREGAISVIDLNQLKETERVVTGGKPQGLEVHPNGERVYVAIRELNEIAILATGERLGILRRIKMDGGPARMAILP